jgi:LysM repeat protein
MKEYFDAKDNCDENFLFAYHQEVAAGVYIGSGLGKLSASSALDSLSQHLANTNSIANQTLVQLHDSGRKPNRVLGVFVDTTRDIAAVQKATLRWSQGLTAADAGFTFSKPLPNAKVYDIAGITSFPEADEPTSTPTPTPSVSDTRHPKGLVKRLAEFVDSNILQKRATCRHIVVEDGDSCATLTRRCGIRGADFIKFNPQSDLCSSLEERDNVCCSAGDPYKPSVPKPEPDGTYATYVIKERDTYTALAKKHNISVKDLEKWN